MGPWMSDEGDDRDAKQIGARVEARMKDLNIKPEELGKTLGLTKNAVEKMVGGASVKGWIKLIKLARALRSSPNELLGFDGDTRGRLTGFLQASYEGLGQSPEAARSYVTAFLKALDRSLDHQGRQAAEQRLRDVIEALAEQSDHK